MKKPSDLIIPFSFKERRPVILERFLVVPPFYADHEKFDKISFNEKIFFNQNDINLEYCSGNGQWIIEKAMKNPDINWIAVEMRFDRARKIWVKMHNLDLKNLFVIYGEGLTFTKYYLPENSLSNIFINFPDPWPKLRHAKNRLITLEFIDFLVNASKMRAVINVVTDDTDAALRTIGVLVKHPSWESLFPMPYYQINCHDYGDSYFHSLWTEMGREIKFIKFKNIKKC